MTGVVYEDIELAAESSGATIVSRDEDGVTIRIPDMVEFAFAWGDANSEWTPEGSYFLGAREQVDGEVEVWKFTYPILDAEG